MEYSKDTIKELIAKQRKYFRSNITLDIDFRIKQLTKLRDAVISNHDKIEEALNKDLSRHPFEGYLCDVGVIIRECNEAINNVRRWAKPETHFSGLAAFPSLFTKVYKIPYGVTLIITPFNFPFVLSLGVLIYSLAAGNTAIIKMTSKSVNSANYLNEMISQIFPPEYVSVVLGGHEVADYLLEERFDKIFYTGSPNIGKHVMKLAAENLTPVALELGGETGNWCIVRKDADILDAARKIAFAKLCNAGQICININQVAVAKEIAPQFIDALKKEIIRQIGDNPSNNKDYPRLISKAAFTKCKEEAEKYSDRIVFGGTFNEETNKFSTTVIYPVDINEDIVKHELFNPLLPIVTYEDNKINNLINTIEDREHGLALYIFTQDVKWAKKVMSSMQYGSGCINEVIMQMVVKGVPFNGVGHSGMGAYHGEWGFREFSHPSTVLIGSSHFNLPMRYHPYNEKNLKTVKKFLK